MVERRRLAGAALAAAPVALLVALACGPAAPQAVGAAAATMAAATAGATPTATPSGTPSPTPSPTPCGSPTATPIPTPTPSPTAAPPPTPDPCASPSPSPTATPPATPSASARPGGGAPAPSGGSSTPSKPPALPSAFVSSDPVLATQVQTILANPVSAQHPDLVHFRPPAPGLAAAAPSPPAPPAVSDPPDLRLPVLVTAVAFGLAALCVLEEMRNRGGGWSLRRTSLQIAAPFAGAVVVAAGAGAFALLGGLWAPPPPAPPPAAAPAATTVSMLSSQRSHSVWLSAGSGSQTWKSLASIESAIDSQHVKLMNDEEQIAAVTNQLGAAAQTPTADALRPSTPGLLKSELQQLVTDHQAVLGSYNDSLQREYSFYVATAQSSQSTAELTSLAAYAPPEVHRAITTNLTMVQTQLQQEAQIAAASAAELARLQATGTEVADLRGPAPSFDAPIDGVLTQPFGTTQLALEPPITYNGVFYPHFHTGIDLAAPLDTPVHAAAAGRVVLAASSVDAQGHLTGYGNFVLIAHADGYNTLYAHLDSVQVTVGEAVQQGEQIGLLGTTGWSTGPHVHFEVRKGAVYVDPAPYLGSQISES